MGNQSPFIQIADKEESPHAPFIPQPRKVEETGLDFGLLPRDQFFRDFQRHSQDVADFRRRAKTGFPTRPVIGYVSGFNIGNC